MKLLNASKMEKVQLKDVMEIISGQAPPSSSYNKSGEGIPFLRVNCFGSRFPITDSYTTKPLKTCEKGDILLSVAGTIGEVNIADKEYAITRSVFALKPKNKKLDLMYLFFYMKALKEKLENLGLGSAQKIITRKSLFDIEIVLPDLEQQKKIAKVFDRIDNLKFQRESTNLLTDNLIKSVYHNFFGDSQENEKGWAIKKMGDVSRIDMGGTPSTKKKEYWENGNINWMRSGDIKSDFITNIPDKITELGLKNSNAKWYNEGDIVIALNGQGKTRGTTGILKVKTTSNQSVANISPSQELTSEYLHFNLKFRYSEIRNITGDKQRRGLNLNILRNFKIQIPPIELQNKFSEFVNKIREARKNQKVTKEEIEKIYNYLSRKIFV